MSSGDLFWLIALSPVWMPLLALVIISIGVAIGAARGKNE